MRYAAKAVARHHRGSPAVVRVTNRPFDCGAMAETSRTVVASPVPSAGRSVGMEAVLAVRPDCAMNSGARVQADRSMAAMTVRFVPPEPSMIGASKAT